MAKHFEYDFTLEICELQLSSSLRDQVIYKSECVEGMHWEQLCKPFD